MTNIYVITVTESPKLYGRKFGSWTGASSFMRDMSEGNEIKFLVTDDLGGIEHGEFSDVDTAEIEIVEPD